MKKIKLAKERWNPEIESKCDNLKQKTEEYQAYLKLPEKVNINPSPTPSPSPSPSPSPNNSSHYSNSLW